MPEDKKEIEFNLDNVVRSIKDLTGGGFRCPACNHGHHLIVEGFITPTVQEKMGDGVVLGGRNLPTVAVVCGKCGYINYFSAKILYGLVNSGQDESNPGNNDSENNTEVGTANSSQTN